MKSRKFLVLFIIASALLAEPLFAACERREGYVELGGYNAITNLFGTTYKYMRTFPGATVTVYNEGTTTLSTVYATSTCTTVKANPMVADTTGYFYFYASGAVFDLKFSGGGITVPFTRRSTLATVDVALCGTCMFTDTEQSSLQRKVFTEDETTKEPLKVYPPDNATAAALLIEENDAGGDAAQKALSILNEANTEVGYINFDGTIDLNGNMDLAGNATFQSHLTASGNLTGGNVISNGTLQALGNTTLSGTLGVTGVTTLGTANITTANITTLNATTTSVVDSTFSIKDNLDATKIAQFQAATISPATTRTYTFPDKSMTLGDVTTDTSQNLTADKRIDINSADTGFTVVNLGTGHAMSAYSTDGVGIVAKSATDHSAYFSPLGASPSPTVVIRAAAGQAEINQLLIQNSAGADVAYIDEDGDTRVNSLTALSSSDATATPTIIAQDSAGGQPANTKMIDVRSNVGASLASIDKEGDILTSGDLTLSSGNINITAGDILSTLGNVTLSNGHLTLTSGNAVLSSGNLTLTSGNALLSNGTLTLTSGDATLVDGALTVASGIINATSSTLGGKAIQVLAGNAASAEPLVRIVGGTDLGVSIPANTNLLQMDAEDGVTTVAYVDAEGDANFNTLETTSGLFTSIYASTSIKLGVGGDTLTYSYTGSVAWNPGMILDTKNDATTVTVTGAAVGSPCYAGYSSITGAVGTGWMLSCSVTALNTATVVLMNGTGVDTDLGNGTVKVVVLGF